MLIFQGVIDGYFSPKFTLGTKVIFLFSWWNILVPWRVLEPKNDGFQSRNLLFQGEIFRFHVKVWESSWKAREKILAGGNRTQAISTLLVI